MKTLKYLLFGRTWKGSVARVFALLIFGLAPFGWYYQPIYVTGISMEPTYSDGQWTLMQRARSLRKDWVPDRFDTIIVWDQHRKEHLCKRVIGLPGEGVQIIEGRIFIDGKKLSDSFGKGYLVVRKLLDPITEQVWWKEYENTPLQIIQPGHIWVIGDNREDSVFGDFPIKKISGKIVLY